MEYLSNAINEDFERIFYISIEALRNACEEDYDACLGYKKASGYVVHNMDLWESVKSKKTDLENFAIDKGIAYTWDGLFEICKGKWLLRYCANNLLAASKTLSDACKNNAIETCALCAKGIYSKCLYKLNTTYQVDHFEQILLRNEHEIKFPF